MQFNQLPLLSKQLFLLLNKMTIYEQDLNKRKESVFYGFKKKISENYFTKKAYFWQCLIT